MHGVKPLKSIYAAAFTTPTWLPPLKTHYNHVLINGLSFLTIEYHPHQGIMPHFDGPNYQPKITTISLTESCQIRFFKLGSNVHTFSLVLEPNSLLEIEGSGYIDYMHGIDDSPNFDVGIIMQIDIRRIFK
jgi:alkylated DNA repair dioxygenase AlkB